MNKELKDQQQHYECIADDGWCTGLVINRAIGQQSSTIGAAEIEARMLPRLRSTTQLRVAGTNLL